MSVSRKNVSEFARFVIVGICNTAIGTATMFICYNFLAMGYWPSSAMNYVVGSIFSYFANKYFTFRSKKKSIVEVLIFITNITVCYLIAYGVAKPCVKWICSNSKFSFSGKITDQIAMVVGMGLFVICNYIGQKLFVFRKRTQKEEDQHEETCE